MATGIGSDHAGGGGGIPAAHLSPPAPAPSLPPNDNCLFQKFIVPKIVLFHQARLSNNQELLEEVSRDPIVGLSHAEFPPLGPEIPILPPPGSCRSIGPPDTHESMRLAPLRLDPGAPGLPAFDQLNGLATSFARSSKRFSGLVMMPPEVLDRIYALLDVQDMIRIAMAARYLLYVFYLLRKRGDPVHNCADYRRPQTPGGYRCEKHGVETRMLVRQMGSGFYDESGRDLMRFCGSCKKYYPVDMLFWFHKIEGDGIADDLPYSVQPVTRYDSAGREVPGGAEGWFPGHTVELHEDIRHKRKIGKEAAEVWCKVREPKGWLERYRSKCCPRCACHEENFRMRTRREVELKRTRDRCRLSTLID